MSEGRTKSLLRKLRSAASTPITYTTTTTITPSSSSLASQKPFRAVYTVDHCGYDLSYRCSSPKRSSSKKTVPSATSFRRAAYTMDGQGYELSGKCHFQRGDSKDPQITTRSYYDWSMEQQPNSFRNLYTMDWKPCNFVRRI
jgi:hypothetical protein